MKTFMFVDVQTMETNKRDNAVAGPILVTTGSNNEAPRAGCRVRVLGPCEIVYNKAGVFQKGQPHVAVVTEAEVEIIEKYGE